MAIILIHQSGNPRIRYEYQFFILPIFLFLRSSKQDGFRGEWIFLETDFTQELGKILRINLTTQNNGLEKI
ncbi:MAG: hypothetical protein CL934_01095 [Deltaproteobacteria bacterium]|nr:hypothetical protein [Deltaproteobacteria bacterium]